MNFINEEVINDIIDLFSENLSDYDEEMVQFSEAQPFILSFLLSDGFNVLDDNEKSLMFYLSIVIYLSILKVHPNIDLIENELLEQIDESNWTIVDQNKYKNLKEIADHMFDAYAQEDLLAFVEDALMEDEEYEISNIGRNVIFVSMKTLIDSFVRILAPQN